MKYLRAILTGAMVWLLVATSFSVMSMVPRLKDSLDSQAMIAALLIIPFATLGTTFYYRNGRSENGLVVGLIMTATSLLLDALIYVPFIEIPNGGTYQSFFTYPLLWLLALVFISTVYFNWRIKVRPGQTE